MKPASATSAAKASSAARSTRSPRAAASQPSQPASSAPVHRLASLAHSRRAQPSARARLGQGGDRLDQRVGQLDMLGVERVAQHRGPLPATAA